MYVNFIINGILLLFTYPLLFILEKTFGFTSNVTLVELSNINNKLMREMSEVAPGTFQHSLQLANLTAAAANRIGANSQLVRTGAMYHDIGKMLNPAFFTENQTGVNPHDQLNYKQSAQIVINHVTDGMKLAEKYKEKPDICNAIGAHHDEMEMNTLLAPIVQVCDAISGARPGARREIVEAYIKRLNDLEAIAMSYPGVTKTYAIQAGRELRVIVGADKMNDEESIKLSDEIATKIQNEMTYPGQVKITVIRETRSVAYAK